MADRSFLEWPFFGPEHRALADRLEAWAKDSVPALAHHGEDSDSVYVAVRELVTALGKAGFLHLTVAAGDRPLDVRSLCLAREILGRHAGLADFAFAMQGLGSCPISLFGTPAQKAQWLPAVGRGEAIAAFALSEPDAGSDVGAMATTARKDGDSWVLDGTKTWISNAGLAAFYVIFARTGEAPGARGRRPSSCRPARRGWTIPNASTPSPPIRWAP